MGEQDTAGGLEEREPGAGKWGRKGKVRGTRVGVGGIHEGGRKGVRSLCGLFDPAVGHWVKKLASLERSSESVSVPPQWQSQVGTMGCLCGKGPVSHQDPPTPPHPQDPLAAISAEPAHSPLSVSAL